MVLNIWSIDSSRAFKLHFLVTLRDMLLMQDGGRCVHKSIYQIMGLTCIPSERCFKKLTSKSTYSATTAATLQHNKWKCWTSILKAVSHGSDNTAAARKGGQALVLPSQLEDVSFWTTDKVKQRQRRLQLRLKQKRATPKHWRTLSCLYQHLLCFRFQQETEWAQAEKGKDADDLKIRSDLNFTVNFCCVLHRSSHATGYVCLCALVYYDFLWFPFLSHPNSIFFPFCCILYS